LEQDQGANLSERNAVLLESMQGDTDTILLTSDHVPMIARSPSAGMIDSCYGARPGWRRESQWAAVSCTEFAPNRIDVIFLL
jgi:hypothetical protein